MWSGLKLVEHQEKKRENLVQAILAYVGTASFLTYRDDTGMVRYSMCFDDQYLSYIRGLHAVDTELGGVEIKPSDPPSILAECPLIWDMEMTGFGAAELPSSTGKRSATSALGTQITDIAYRLMICQRVPYSRVITEYVNNGGNPQGICRKVAGMAAREAVSFVMTDAKNNTTPKVTPKKEPYTHTRIILGARDVNHLEILRDSFPAGSIKKRGVIKPETIHGVIGMPPPARSVHTPVFNDEELGKLEIIPTRVTEVPMPYGRAITSTTQPPIRFPDILFWDDNSTTPGYSPLFLADENGNETDDSEPGIIGNDSVEEPNNSMNGEPVMEEPATEESSSGNGFGFRIINGKERFPVRVIPG